jgi:ubiquinol-cytochrome c reductase subunit 8
MLGSPQKSALSPYQTKAAPHWLRSYIFNGYRRISGEILFFGIPFVVGAYPL